MSNLRQIVSYGKADIGKSITSQHTLAALVELGQQILIACCDLKTDFTRLWSSTPKPRIRRSAARRRLAPSKIWSSMTWLKLDYQGIKCVESGGPELGVGCAGHGVITAIIECEKCQLSARPSHRNEAVWTIGDLIPAGGDDLAHAIVQWSTGI